MRIIKWWYLVVIVLLLGISNAQNKNTIVINNIIKVPLRCPTGTRLVQGQCRKVY